MVCFEMRTSLKCYSLSKSFFHLSTITLIIFTTSGLCLPRLMEISFGDVARKSSQGASLDTFTNNNQIDDELAVSLKNKHFNKNMLLSKDSKIKKPFDRNLKVSQKYVRSDLKNVVSQSENEKSQSEKLNWKSQFPKSLDAHGYFHNNSQTSNESKKELFTIGRYHQNRTIPSRIFNGGQNLQLDTAKSRADDQRYDDSINDLTNEKIMDYFFHDTAAKESDHRRRHRNPGIIINLNGLIPYDDILVDKLSSSTTDREVKSGNDEELLAFRAFEIDSLPQPDSQSASLTEDEEGTSDVIDISKVTSRVGFIEEPTSESRNLSRKRRQKASPNGEDAEDEEHSRRRFFRRRRRKRKRRHRHSKTADDVTEDGDVLRQPFLLKSHGPAYVITSAKELKKDWCRTVPLKQRIEEKNCKPKIISNNFCYGQCNSFFIPHQGRTGNSAAFQSCAFCKPNKQRWIHVTLQCPGQEPNKIDKKILLVESCRCMTEVLQ